MASAVMGSDDASKRRSIIIVEMPVEFINRDLLKKHFDQFGTVERLSCSVSKKFAVLHFRTEEEAVNAAARGAVIRPDAPRLKIVTGGTRLDVAKPSTSGSGPSSSLPPAKLVTKRRIVRNFEARGHAPTTSASPSTSMSKSQPQHPGSGDRAPETRSLYSASSSSAPGPFRSSLKTSRPSPFLRKRSSFGDKTGKSGAAPRNPFGLPPRSMLSLDRRKKTSTSPTKKEDQGQAQASSEGETSTSTSSFQSPQGRLDSDDSIQVQKFTIRQDPQAGAVPSLFSNVTDETSDPVIRSRGPGHVHFADEAYNFGDESGAEGDGRGHERFDEDTQDTAEITTEEEGELVGNEDYDHDDHEDDNYGEQDEEITAQDEDDADDDVDGDDEPFESPLKRMASASSSSNTKASESSTPGSSTFSFKTTATPTPPASTGPLTESTFSFKSSPFSSSSFSSKPFSSSTSAFGGSFGVFGSGSGSGSGGSSSIFAGTGTAPSQPSASLSSSSSSEQPVLKKPAPEPPSVTQPSFGGFGTSSVFGQNPISFKSLGASTTTSKPTTTSTAAPAASAESSTFSISKPQPLPTKKIALPAPAPVIIAKSLGAPAPPAPSTSTSAKHSSGKKDYPNPLLLTFYPDTSEAQELFNKKSTTAEERYRILEARDKIIRSRVPKTKVNVEFATKLIGTCPDMCPEKERYMRQFQRQLVFYETLPSQEKELQVDHYKAVKVYSRSSADQEEPLPHELRPGPTLDFTMHYLLRYIVPLGDNPDENLSDWYNFLWDRTRSIRKDITQQQITDLTAVSLYEKCTRFHIHCASRLCELDMHSFDPKLNDENLMKCLQSLEHLYDDLRRRQVRCPNEPEFRAYQIMMNLNEGDALYNAQQLPDWILNSEQVQVALKLHHSIYTKNFVRFFKLVEGSPYMTACILHRYFFQVRSLALRCFLKAHCTLPKYETAMPMSTLQRMLGYGPDQPLSFSYLCEAHGIHCDVDEGRIILKRKFFHLPEYPSIYRESHLVDSKLSTSVADAINGSPLPEIDFTARTPHSSFTDDGQLVSGNIVPGVGPVEPPRSNTSTAPAKFVPPEISSSSTSSSSLSSMFKFQAKPAPAPVPAPFGITSQSQPFSFGEGLAKQRKEIPPLFPIPIAKPRPNIQAACESATNRLIEESVKKDVAELSSKELSEAKRVQRKKLVAEIAARLSSEFAEKIISGHVTSLLSGLAGSKFRQLKLVENVSCGAVNKLAEDHLKNVVQSSAKVELVAAKESHYRLMTALKRIFSRVRARLAFEKWLRFTRNRQLEREREEELRREKLWNFPPINPFSNSTRDVFRAFCGKGKAQPLLNKLEILNSSPEHPRPKRKSDGDTTSNGLIIEGEPGPGPRKLPRLSSGSNIAPITDPKKLQELWDFPVVNPYARTNKQVLEALCGRSSNTVANLPVSPKITAFGAWPTVSRAQLPFTKDVSPPFQIRRPPAMQQPPVGVQRVSEEIKSKAGEGLTDLLHDIQKFSAEVKSELAKSADMQPIVEGVQSMDETCSQLNASISSLDPDLLEPEDGIGMENEEEEWKSSSFSHQNLISGVFREEEELLSQIRNFVHEVRVEKAKYCWNSDTFLNSMDVENLL